MQTPQFTISTNLEQSLDVNLELSVRYGTINGGSLDSKTIGEEPEKGLMGLKLHEISTWASTIDRESLLSQLNSSQKDGLVDWLEEKLPTTL